MSTKHLETYHREANFSDTKKVFRARTQHSMNNNNGK